MTKIIYAKKAEDTSGELFTLDYVREVFSDAGSLIRRMQRDGVRMAYFFIDPLLYHFEAGNEFYFDGLEIDPVENISYYRTGAGPVHAVSEAKKMIEKGMADAVSIFTYEPLYYNKKHRGKEAVQKAMDDVFKGVSLIECYNRIGEQMCGVLGISREEFMKTSDALYDNYRRTYEELHGEGSGPSGRGKNLADSGGDLFYLTDIANPNIDFAGGVIIGNDEVYEKYNSFGEAVISIRAAAHGMVYGTPERIPQLVGAKDDIFPHLHRVFDKIEDEGQLIMREELDRGNLLLNAYTCYPPIPMALLMTGGFVDSFDEIGAFLKEHQITIDGGMSLARAAWNNPAFSAFIGMCEKLRTSEEKYGLVHGNGGMGESHGLVLVERVEKL
ncbi:MAG: hypothetical protein IJB73_01530 [Firmicutes bacterium]|nr:hypothetical protein [Bacillota bacterium]